jgi:hypothetical protein
MAGALLQAHIFCALVVQQVSVERGYRAIPETGVRLSPDRPLRNYLQPINLFADDAADGSSGSSARKRIEECRNLQWNSHVLRRQ